jgi:hypothetical protein
MSILESEERWEEEKKSCPGIGKGRLYTKEEIDGLLEIDLKQTPIIRD